MVNYNNIYCGPLSTNIPPIKPGGVMAGAIQLPGGAQPPIAPPLSPDAIVLPPFGPISLPTPLPQPMAGAIPLPQYF